MMKRQRKRIELIDLAKAITIFLVILGHTTGNLDTPMYRRVLYSFHMPLFFFLAGLSIKPSLVKGWEMWLQFLKKNILALVVPFLVWGLIYAPFSFSNFPKLLYASWAALGKIGTLTSLWYLSAFFVARIMVQIIVSICVGRGVKKSLLFYVISASAMFAIGFLLPGIDNGYPWCLDVAFVASGFILLGIAFRMPILILAQQKGVVLCSVFLGSLGLFLCGTVLRGDALELSLMCNAGYGNIFWFMSNSITGSMAVMGFCMLFIRMAREGLHPFSFMAVNFIGMHTMGIFLLHKNMLQQLILPWMEKLFNGAGFPSVFFGSCIALLFSVALCVVIERYVPQLLGLFPKSAESSSK